MINYINKLLAIILFFFVYGCSLKNSVPFPDISHIDEDLEIIRTEYLLFEGNNPYNSILELEKNHPEIKDLYIKKLLQLDKRGQNLKQNVPMFFENKAILSLYDSVKTVLPEIDIELKRVENAFKYYKYYFPNNQYPKVFTAITEFAPSAFTLDSLALGISLEMYLGKDFVYYPSLEFPKYISDHFEIQNLPSNTMYAWFNNKFPLQKESINLLDEMIQNGKVLYMLDLCLPNTNDFTKINYYKDDIYWCAQNEKEIWSFFIEKDLLYETNKNKYSKYINAAPTSSGMPPESPGNVGSWIGWQIVKSFMQNNKNISPSELMEIKEGQKILMKSRYRP